jgi:hypothetical protein
MAHEHSACPVELHETRGLEVHIERLAQGAALAQPPLRGQLRARRGHAPDDHTDDRGAL